MSATTILLLWQHSGHPPRAACQSPGSLQAFIPPTNPCSLLGKDLAPHLHPVLPALKGLHATQQGRNHRTVAARQGRQGDGRAHSASLQKGHAYPDTSTHNRIQIYWNTDFQNFCLLALQMRTKSASSYRKVCAPQKAATTLQPKLKTPASKIILKRVKCALCSSGLQCGCCSNR